MNELFADGNVTSFLCCNNSCYGDYYYYSTVCVSTVESCRLIFRCCFSSSELHVITGPDIINFRLWVRSTFPPYFHFYGARYNKKKERKKNAAAFREFCRRVIKKQQQSLSGSLLFFFVCEVVLECPHHSQNESTRSTQ